MAQDAGWGGGRRLRDPGAAKKPAGARGSVGVVAGWPRPARRPRARSPAQSRAACKREGSADRWDSGAQGWEPESRLWPPPLPSHDYSPFPLRAPSEAFSSFFDLISVNSSTPLRPSRPAFPPLPPSPSSRAHHSFSVLIPVPPGIPFPHYPFAASSSLRLCFFRRLPPKELVPARGPRQLTVVPLHPRDGGVCGSQHRSRSTSAPPSPWRDSEAQAPPAFSPGDSARAGSRPGAPSSNKSSWRATGATQGGCRHCALRPGLPQNRTFHRAGAGVRRGGLRQQVTLRAGGGHCTCLARGPGRPWLNDPGTRLPHTRLWGLGGGGGRTGREQRRGSSQVQSLPPPGFTTRAPSRVC